MFYCFLAKGFEEIEAVTTVDILRRAGIEIKTVAVNEGASLVVCGAHNIPFVCDISINDCKAEESLEGVFLPGGMPGTTNLDNSQKIRELITYCADNDKYLFAICAAPSVFGHMGLLRGKKATCYPGFESELEGAEYTANAFEKDGRIITGKGPGVTIQFALCIVEELKGKDVALELKAGMQCHE